MALQLKIKNLAPLNDENSDNNEHIEAPTSTINNNLNAPKHGTVIPNRVFVGGIAPATTELDLIHLFSNYGNVTGTKIISDRAGVSKGYGFVTFETEEEAKRLQKDADNISLGQRRLNIAPAVKKQAFSRGGYDCNAGSPIPPTQVYRHHNGITYTFHNGMAFFPQPTAPPAPPLSHMETPPVFQHGATYNAVQPSSPGPAYQPYSYAPQGQMYYTPQYQYHVPQYDGGYEGGQVMVPDSNLVIPQYYLAAPHPAPELAYYQPAHPQETAMQQVIYTSPRTYESAVVYSTEPKCGMENNMGNHGSGGIAVVNKEEGDSQVSNNRRRRESTPVVSLLNIYKGKEESLKRKPQNHYLEDGRRHQNLNNNNPEAANRNIKQQEARRGTPPSNPSYPNSHANPNHRRPTVQVPQFPYYPRQVIASQAALASFYPPPPPQARPRSYYRPRYGGRGGGRGNGNSKWMPKEEELGQPLTPPVTPRSEPAGVAGTSSHDEIVQSMQALAI